MCTTTITIRPEHEGDEAAIRAVNEAAFNQPGEAALVDALRKSGGVFVSLVAEVGASVAPGASVASGHTVAGHILFTPVRVLRKGAPAWDAVALGPMAVTTGWQSQGIGSALVRAGLAACRNAGAGVVFVLGHPSFYPRFGFTPASGYGIDSRYNAGDAFMLVELVPGALMARRGTVVYDPAFDPVT